MNNNRHDLTLFRHSITWLEKYIEQSRFRAFSDWEQRKQTNTSVIRWVKSDTPTSKILKSLGTCLLIHFAWNGKDKDNNSPEEREVVKSEFYKWLDTSKIDNNCPQELKLVLFTMHEIYSDKKGGYRLLKSAENAKRELDPDSPEYQEQLQKVFSSVAESHANGEAFKVDNGPFNGNAETGKIVFEKIANSLSAVDKKNFHFWPQENSQKKIKDNQEKVNNKLDQHFSGKNIFKKEPNITQIILIISGVLVSLGLILAFFIFWYRKKNEPKRK